MKKLVLFSALSIALSSPVVATAAEVNKRFGDWTAVTNTDDFTDEVSYMLLQATPDDKSAIFFYCDHRKMAHLDSELWHWGSGKYPEMQLRIDGNEAFTVNGQTLDGQRFVMNESAASFIVLGVKFKAGNSVKIQSYDGKDRTTVQTFSLNGFTAAAESVGCFKRGL